MTTRRFKAHHEVLIFFLKFKVWDFKFKKGCYMSKDRPRREQKKPKKQK